MSARTLPPRRPQSERRHWVFLYRCGCPFGLVELSKFYKTEDDAWDGMFDTRSEERRARAAGVRVEYVDHATYSRDFYPRMTQDCTHGGMQQ
ncbi:hypothetical protein Ade02nite_19270 [Paractinoplanes deccanensis]|uniref:Uncharacterized protein n=1 Tax=Paractinoplanes deccanensis TaxID=113561 RepID=A0ABQ3XZW2_9ACTN|nr:hypothetical protein [Actinoplanes deccanensis]GID73286.1 hypothetical protein Ade02nite_19270 [Actinoplanes deccanensis]